LPRSWVQNSIRAFRVAKKGFLTIDVVQFEPLTRSIQKMLETLDLDSDATRVGAMKDLDTKLVTLRARLLQKMKNLGISSLLSTSQHSIGCEGVGRRF